MIRLEDAQPLLVRGLLEPDDGPFECVGEADGLLSRDEHGHASESVAEG
jgi:hypothetical protein